MFTSRLTVLLALLLGTLLGFGVAVSGGVLALRGDDGAGLPPQDARLLAEAIERVKRDYVERVDDHELMQHAIRGMIAGLDAHSSFLDGAEYDELRIASEGSYTGIGVEVSYEGGDVVVVAPIEDSPADRAGLRTGDVIVAIDGRSVKAAGLADSIGRMRGRAGTLVRVAVERGTADEPVDYVIERARIAVRSVRQASLVPGYGYLRITHFSETTPQDLRAAIGDLRQRHGGRLAGLVLDLRGNPGGVLESGTEVADAFLDRGLIVSASGRTRDARFTIDATRGDDSGGAALAVLINGGSASAAEIVAGALRDHGRARLFGRRTFGKGSVQTLVPLSGGQAIKLTTSHYYTPDGTSIHEHGIEPDVALPRDDASSPRPEPGGDAEVVAALDWLRSVSAAQPAAAVAAR